MPLRVVPAPVWFVAALLPLLASQIVRLHQSDPAAWIFWDYAGRLGALAVLGAVPSARDVAFGREALRITVLESVIWIVGIILVDHYLCGWLRRTINSALPATVLGVYPQPHGWLHAFDNVFGIALVAYSEETVFRRCALRLLRRYFNNKWVLVVISSVLFGAYHWWTGVGNIAEAVLVGILLMLFYQRSKALWPVVLAHYLTDIVEFAF
jgi:membrane protease YdiL (CAAX protease family)